MNHLKIQCNCSPNQCEASPTETYGIYTTEVNIFCTNAFKQKRDIKQTRWTLVTFVTPKFLLSKQFPVWIPVAYSLNETTTHRDVTKASAIWLLEEIMSIHHMGISDSICVRWILLFVSGCESPQRCNYVNLWSCGIWADICKISVRETPCWYWEWAVTCNFHI